MTFLRPVRELTWKHWAWATAIPILIAMTGPLRNFHQNWYWAHWRILSEAPWYLFFSYTMLVAIAIVEASAPGKTGPRMWRYLVALVAATAIYATALAAFPGLVLSPPKEIRSGETIVRGTGSAEDRSRERRNNLLLGVPGAMTNAWVATFIYVRFRKSRRAAQALADAEFGRSEAQRNLLAAQLVAAHAQVDPAFVLQKLEEVERAYEIDPARADDLMDEFIAFLRDAIPRLREERVEVK
ncbi:MAG TPA: hypothetical protein VFE23_21420 [Usitatibacter sp.]|nr:hypothetical protein [Usitatibacter sp.]